MRLPLLAIAALVLARSPVASAAPARGEGEPLQLRARVSAVAGGFSGQGTRRESGALGVLDARAALAARLGSLELDVPARVERVETLGADLSQTRASVAVEPSWRPIRRLKLGAEAGVVRVWRLGWQDQYQPNPDLTLQHTNRYSYVAWRAGANVYAQPAAHQHLRLRWRMTSYEYTRDPNWDPNFPTHITPRDNVQHAVDGSWRYLQRDYAVALRLETTFRRDSVYPARHALTGSVRTPTRTPHQRLNDYEPSTELELRRLADGHVKVSLRFGWAVRDDAYEGYYSYSGPHPRAVVEWSPLERLELAATAEAWWLRYGPSSRDPNRPTPNEGGTRLHDQRRRVELKARCRIGGGLSAIAEGEWVWRETNYPDYVPGVFPSTRLYDIRWDYQNLRAVAGLEWRI